MNLLLALLLCLQDPAQGDKPKTLPLPPVIRPGSIVSEVWRDYCVVGG